MCVCCSLIKNRLIIKNSQNSNLMGLITPLTILTWSFFIIAYMCECGERVTEQFYLFNEKLNRCKWYCFPLDVQRIMLIFLGDAQQTIYIRGYANILCTRDSFKKVQKGDWFHMNYYDWFCTIFIRFASPIQTVHGGLSYFMLLRQIDGWSFY